MVRFEIIENYRIVVMNFCNRFVVFFCDDGWNDEFIMNVVCIRIVYYIYCVFVRWVFVVSYCVVCFFYMVLVFVVVYGVVVFGNVGDFVDIDFFDLFI